MCLSALLSGCASDGNLHIRGEVPLGESSKYGALLLDFGYRPPYSFADVIENPAVLQGLRK
jgi:hypothetical protein